MSAHISVRGRVFRYLILKPGSAYQISRDLKLRYHSVFDALRFYEREKVVEPTGEPQLRNRRDYRLVPWVEEANVQWVKKILQLRNLAGRVNELGVLPKEKRLNALAALFVNFLDGTSEEASDLVDLTLRFRARPDFPSHERMAVYLRAHELILNAFCFRNAVTFDEFSQLRAAAPLLLSMDHGLGVPLQRLSARQKRAAGNKDTALLLQLEGYEAWHQRQGWYLDLATKMEKDWDYLSSEDPVPSQEFARLAILPREELLKDITERLNSDTAIPPNRSVVS